LSGWTDDGAVTGAGGGLGRAHALLLAQRGAAVVVNDFGGARDGSAGSTEAADAVVAEITSAGGRAIANGGNVTSEADMQALAAEALAAFGRIDVLINNAGILRDKSFAKMTMEEFRQVVDVHLSGSAQATKAVWGAMREQGYGRILMTSSTSGSYGNFGQAYYGAAKMGVLELMNVLHAEGAKYGIHTNAILPTADRDAMILENAERRFFIETLETRNRDRLDFHDVAVWAIRNALEEAFEAGRRAGATAAPKS